MKALAGYAVGLIVVAIYIIAWLISLYVSRNSKNRTKKWGWITGGFLVPVLAILGWSWWLQAAVERDWEYFQQLCSDQAGDKVYKTVKGVEGIFQIRPRDEEVSLEHSKRTGIDDAARDQFGLEDPYGHAIHDRSGPPEVFLARFEYANPKFPRYRFVETLRAYGAPNAPPFKRYELVKTGKQILNSITGKEYDELELRERPVDKIEAIYGYTWEDLSTREMREKYIAGGRFIIKDLRTDEVLAERTGFVFARYRNGARDKYFWGNSDNRCPDGTNVPRWIQDFVFSVLHPSK